MKHLCYLICLLFTGCVAYEPQTISDERLHLLNYSDKKIYALFCTNYPDTTIVTQNNELLTFPVKQGNNVVYPRCITLSKTGSWDSFFKSKDSSYRLQIYVFEASVIENVSWNEIVRKQLILKRLNLSYLELKKKKWDVIFQE